MDVRRCLFGSHDVNLGVDVLLPIQLYFQLARANPLDKFPDADLDGKRILRFNQFLPQHPTKGVFYLGSGWRIFLR
ncbi:MAG: hypothetical protein WC073_08990 [Sterolibacterium sp.]